MKDRMDVCQSRSPGASLWRAMALAALLLVLGACSAVPDKPVRPLIYDFGPGPLAAAPLAGTPLRSLVLPEVEAGNALDGTAVLYRLAYSDAQQLRPYAMARWSMTPAQLVRQRLGAALSRQRAVLGNDDRAVLNRGDGAWPFVLRVELEEFSQLFEAADRSAGLVRLRATLIEGGALGEKFVAQRNVVIQRPAATLDAVGGVRALTAATDAAVEEIVQWLQQQR